MHAESAQVAIFDATNSTEQRRQLLVSAAVLWCSSSGEAGRHAITSSRLCEFLGMATFM